MAVLPLYWAERCDPILTCRGQGSITSQPCVRVRFSTHSKGEYTAILHTLQAGICTGIQYASHISLDQGIITYL